MPTYIVTGKLGGGKTLAMVGRIRDYLESGRPVATNIDVDLAKLLRKPSTAPAYRLPDRPTVADLEAIGAVHLTGQEERNGALVLDECGTWLNARLWNDKGRAELIDWFLHARKRGWDVYLIVQSLGLIDKQLRDTLGEYVVICRRMDRVKIPGIGRVINALSLGYFSGALPKLHVASVRYGAGPSSIHADTWYFRGRELYGAYNTAQIVTKERNETRELVFEVKAKPVRRLKPKLRAVQLAATLPRDQAWQVARQYVRALSCRAEPSPWRATIQGCGSPVQGDRTPSRGTHAVAKPVVEASSRPTAQRPAGWRPA